jgi:rSAM/selenodomain-associated transferase 1
MSRWQVAVLARAPVPGAAKTRLIPRLGAERAAALQADLTDRAVRRARAAGADVVLWIAGPIDAALAAIGEAAGAELRRQPDGDLGARMHAAAVHAHAAGMPAVIIGTDCPAQQPGDLMQARAMLDGADLVLQPAHDGGYVLIAMKRPQPEVFRDIPWGSETVLDMTRRRGVEAGLHIVELRALPDLDDTVDLDLAIARGWIDRERWSST